MICLAALRTVSFKSGAVVESVLSKSNATKLCRVIHACTGGFYGSCANIHLGNRSLAFQENVTPS